MSWDKLPRVRRRAWTSRDSGTENRDFAVEYARHLRRDGHTVKVVKQTRWYVQTKIKRSEA